MPKMTIQEARELGLLSPEELAALGHNPFTPRAGASWTPNLGIRPGLNSSSFFRYPGLYQRPGISSLRFGLGGLGQGLTLSPESPALGLGGIAGPIGRSAASGQVGRGVAGGIAGGIAGGVAGGRAAIGSEGSGNLPSMILPDGRRLVRMPDGRAYIVGGPRGPVSAEAPEGMAALQAMGFISQGVGAVKQLADLISKIPGGTPGGTPGGMPGGVPGGAPGGVVEEGPGAGLVQPASLQQGPATPAAALLPPDYLEGLSPEDLAALGELGMNTDLRGPAAPGGGPLAPVAPPDMAQFGPGTTFEMPGGGAGKPGLPLSLDPFLGQAGPTVTGDVVQPGSWSGQPPMFPGGITEDGAGKPAFMGQEPGGDLSLSPAFYAPGGGSAADVLLDPETRRLYELGLTPEQVMGMMPAPAAGRADTAPRGLGPSESDIFAPEPAGPGVTTNFNLSNVAGLGQSLLGVGQGAIGAGITGDPSQLVGALLKSGLSINQIAKIPGLNQAGISAGLGGALGLLNTIQAMRRGDVTGAIGGGLGTVGSAANFVASSPALQAATGLSSTAAGAAGAIAGGAGGLLSLASGIQGLIAGGASPMQSALQLAGGLTGTYGAIASLSAAYPALFGTVLPSLSSLAGSGLTAIGLPGVASALGLGAGIGAGVGAGTAAAAAGGASAASVGAAAMGGSVAGGAATGVGGLGAAGAGLAAAAPVISMVAVPYLVGSIVKMVAEGQHAKSMKQAAERMKGLVSSIPGHMAALQRVPGIVQQIQTATPEQSVELFKELSKIEEAFDSSGMEDFIQSGMTQVSGGRDLGSGASMVFDQAQKVRDAIKPYIQALDYGRLIAQDKAQAAGLEVPGALSPEVYAMSLGDTAFQEALRPSSTNRGSQLARYLGTNTNFGSPTVSASGAGYGTLDAADARATAPFWAEVATPELLAFAGLPTEGYAKMNYSADDLRNTLLPGGAMHGRLDPALVDTLGPARVQEMLGLGKVVPTVGDIRNALSAGGAMKGRADEFGQTTYGFAHLPTYQRLGTLQPGQYEQGLRDFFAQGGYGSGNQLFTAAGQPAPATPSGSMAFDPLKFLSSLEAGERAQIQSGQDTLTFVPYKPDQSQMFQAPDAGYEQIGEGFYAKASGQGAGAEIYLPQDRASDLGKALAGYQASPVAGQVGALLVPSGQEAGATPGAGPAGDIAPEAVAAGTSSTVQPVGTVAPPPDASQPVPGSGFKKGGVVPKTGKYLVHEGEVVIPADKADTEAESEEFLEDMRKRGDLRLGGPKPKLEMPKMGPGPLERGEDPTMPDEAAAVGGVRLAHHEESETVQDEDTGKWVNVYGRNIKGKAGQRLPNSGEYDTVEEAEAAAGARSEAEGQKGSAKPPKVKGWYVHIKEGVPSQDLDGNDPMVRRLAFTPDEVEQAIEAGEAPIMVGKGVLALPPSAIRGFLQNAQNMQNKDPMKHPAMVAMGNRIRQAQSMKPEGDTLPYPGIGAKILRGNQPRFKGDRGRSADRPLDAVGGWPTDIGGGLTGADDSFRNMDVLPKSMPEMPAIPDAVPTPNQFQVRGLGGPGIGRAMRLAQGPSEDFARQDRMLEGIDRGTIAPSTLGGASREQRQNLTPQDIMRRPSRPAGATQPQPQPGLLEQFRRRTLG